MLAPEGAFWGLCEGNGEGKFEKGCSEKPESFKFVKECELGFDAYLKARFLVVLNGPPRLLCTENLSGFDILQ